MEADLLADLKKLVEKHCRTLNDEVSDVSRCLEQLQPDALNEDETAALLQSIVHRMKGSSGTLGFMEISAAAKSLEQGVMALRSSDTTVTAPDILRLRSMGTTLQGLIRAVRPEDSTIYRMKPG